MSLVRYILLWCMPLLAYAGADLAPFNGGGGVQVQEGSKDARVFYPLDPGNHLDYAFSGPGRVWVYVRSGARPSGAWGYPSNMELPLEVVSTRIDGIPLAPALDSFANLVDTESTYPWLSKGILIDVPEGSNSFRLSARLDGPPLLVRIMVPGTPNTPEVAQAPQALPEPAAVEVSPEPALLDDAFYGEESPDAETEAPPAETEDTPLAEEVVAEEDVAEEDVAEEDVAEEDVAEEAATAPIENPEEEEVVAEIIDAIPDEPVGEATFGGRYEIFDEEAQTLEQAPEAEDEEVVDLSKEDEPEAVELGGFSDRLIHSLKSTRVSIGTGVGAPMQGNQAIASANLSARVEIFPILTDQWAAGWGRLDLALRTGWYRVGVKETLVVPDAIAGNSEIEVSYATHVFPIALGLHYDIPIRIGRVVPFVGAGGGLNAVRRFGETPSSALSGGWYATGGALISAGPVEIAPSLVFNGASAVLDRTASGGSPVTENLSTLRLNLAVQTHF